MEKKIFAVDFDGTCVRNEYPGIGKDTTAYIMLRKLVKCGHKIILWTVRSGDELTEAVNWFREKEIPLFGINENPNQKAWSDSPKAYAHYYIDDKSIGVPLVHGEHTSPFVDWVKLCDLLPTSLFVK